MDLEIENVPPDLVERLNRRAARNPRSLDDELLAIIMSAADEEEEPMARESPSPGRTR
jgi:plasmid stability protein